METELVKKMDTLLVEANILSGNFEKVVEEIEKGPVFGRSNYALRHFVVGAHDLPGRQRQQVLSELMTGIDSLSTLIEEYNEIVDKEEKTPKDLRRILILRVYIRGKSSEVREMLRMLDEIPAYTSEEFEREEEEYWKLRLTRQHYLASRGDFGNFDAVLQMFTEPGKPKPPLPATFGEVKVRAGITSIMTDMEKILPPGTYEELK